MLYIEKLGFDCKYKVRFEIGSGSPGLQIDDRTCGNLIGQLATASTIAKAPRGMLRGPAIWPRRE